ncbi:MAG: hypothetical protein DBY44_02185 [Veillonellaceae bacterium]|nr:MAG: hypothetical protein DBY44_02185 [Veillonellaceae bacterium]
MVIHLLAFVLALQLIPVFNYSVRMKSNQTVTMQVYLRVPAVLCLCG